MNLYELYGHSVEDHPVHRRWIIAVEDLGKIESYLS